MVLLGCTSFCLNNNNQPIFGTNYENKIPEGYLFLNKRNLKKKGIVPNILGQFVEWISIYGSVTFNLASYQYNSHILNFNYLRKFLRIYNRIKRIKNRPLDADIKKIIRIFEGFT